MNFNKKLFFGISILIAYIIIGVFGMFQLDHKTEMRMDKCPYTQNSFTVCENTLTHITSWQQFSKTMTTLFFIFSFIVLVFYLYSINKKNLLVEKLRNLYRRKYYLNNKFSQALLIKTSKWLSLFEGSPNFS